MVAASVSERGAQQASDCIVPARLKTIMVLDDVHSHPGLTLESIHDSCRQWLTTCEICLHFTRPLSLQIHFCESALAYSVAPFQPC